MIIRWERQREREERRREERKKRREIKKEEKDDFSFPPIFLSPKGTIISQGATLLISLGNIEHSLTLAMPRKQAVMRSRPMAKPP